MAWGNNGDVTHTQDMISGADHHRILKVNDVNENLDEKIALHTIINGITL